MGCYENDIRGRAGGHRPAPLASLAALLWIASCAPAAPDEAQGSARSRPNIVLIVLDTTRPDHLSTYGAARETSPNLDRLAKSSVVYRRAHSVAPWTLPAHMSMFTGLYPGEHTATWAAFEEREEHSILQLARTPFRFLEGERLLGRRLKEAGYATLAVSGNSWVSSGSGFDEGFDWFCDTWTPLVKKRAWYAQFPDALKISPGIDHGKAGRNLLELRHYFATHEVKEPFFAFLNFIDPHFPYVPPDEFKYEFDGEPQIMNGVLEAGIPSLELKLLAGDQPFDLRRLVPFYDAELFYTDLVLGHLFDWLVEQGYDDNTMIVVTSDHGEHLGEGGRFSHQLSVEEQVLRVPLLIRYPDRRGAGSSEDHPLVSNMDVYETILAAAGVSPRSFARPGRSLDLARMDAFDREFLLAENYYCEAYLSRLEKEYPAFDIAAQRIVRRAVYTAEHKYALHGTTLLEGTASPGPDSPERARVEAWIQHYARSIEPLDLLDFDGPEDVARGESLKALGYLGDD